MKRNNPKKNCRDQITESDDKNENTTKNDSMSLSEFECKNAKQILYKKQCQNEKEGKTQFEVVGELDGITGEAGKFIKLSDILYSAWDSPELCEATLLIEQVCDWSLG